MSTDWAGSPSRVLPVPGFSWPPVMAVVRLSRMMVSDVALVVGDVHREVMPEWKKVLSPMIATGLLRYLVGAPAVGP